jgi:hypothetical protein
VYPLRSADDHLGGGRLQFHPKAPDRSFGYEYCASPTVSAFVKQGVITDFTHSGFLRRIMMPSQRCRAADASSAAI